jgi:hypothetical protein
MISYHAPQKIESALGDFSIQIRMSYSPEADIFSLSETTDQKPFELILNSEHIQGFESSDFEPGLYRLDDVQGLREGMNELSFTTPPAGGLLRPQAAQCRIFKGHEVLFEKTFWIDQGESLSKSFRLEINSQERVHDHEHT